MRKKMYFLILDTETATVPWVADIACDNGKIKQQIALAKPLVYDIGWLIVDRCGNVVKKVNYLVSEIFGRPEIFQTAYYYDKRDIYFNMMASGELSVMSWEVIAQELKNDCDAVDFVCAYNANFDFKKAIPYTERFISHCYSNDWEKWSSGQKFACTKIAQGEKAKGDGTFSNPIFYFRDAKYPMIDIWGMSCQRLINIDKYRNFCFETGQLSASAKYFKTSAETCFQYCLNQYDFIESHTALDDAEIETQLLIKCLKKGKAETCNKAFPFQLLGTTDKYVLEKKPKYKDVLIDLLTEYLNGYNGSERYKTQVRHTIEKLGGEYID